MHVQVSLTLEIAASASLAEMEQPTRCATSWPFQVKWLQMRLCCIAGFDTKVEALAGR